MLYAKTFKLKPYWNEFMQKVDEYRTIKFGVRNDWKRPTAYYPIDGNEWVFGASAHIIPPDKVNLFIDEDLEKIYHKPNLALKVFSFCPQPLSTKMYFCRWGKNANLIDATKIQNIFAKGGFAPWVMALVSLETDDCKYVAQVTEYIDHDELYDKLEQNDPIFKALTDYAYDNRIRMFDVLEGKNFLKGKLVDFEFFEFNNNKQKYNDLINDKVSGLCFGGDDLIPYQSIEELNIKGRRNNIEREKFFRLKEDVKPNSSALDVGCNGGYFLRRCMDYGATYTVGVDLPEVAETAQTINNYLGYFNMNFVSELPQGKFDIVFYLSGTGYGIDDSEVFKRVGNVLYFEGHSGQTEKECRELLKDFEIQVMGYTNDYPESGERIILRCQK